MSGSLRLPLYKGTLRANAGIRVNGKMREWKMSWLAFLDVYYNSTQR